MSYSYRLDSYPHASAPGGRKVEFGTISSTLLIACYSASPVSKATPCSANQLSLNLAAAVPGLLLSYPDSCKLQKRPLANLTAAWPCETSITAAYSPGACLAEIWGGPVSQRSQKAAAVGSRKSETFGRGSCAPPAINCSERSDFERANLQPVFERGPHCPC